MACRISLTLFICLGALTATAHAGKFNKKLSVGDAAPKWSELMGTDDKPHSLDNYDSGLLLVIFTCNQCPIAQGYQDRVVRIATDYKQRDVSVVAINPNRGKAETLEKMKKRTKDAGLPYDYLKDESQAAAKAYGARVTPTAFLVNADRKIIYMGAIDDNWQAVEAVEHRYLVDAMNSALSGKSPDIAETLATGCAISYLADDE